MTVKNIIDILKGQGHQIEFYKRKDGGYLIRSIDGMHFEGAKGNEQARAMMGIAPEQAMSAQKRAQLSGITKLRKQSSEFKRVYKETAKIWKAEVKKGNLKIKGRIKPQTWTKYAKEYGEEEAIKALTKAQKYAQGFAYTENIEYFCENKLQKFIDGYMNEYGSEADYNVVSGVAQIKDYLLTHKEEIKESTLHNLIQNYYDHIEHAQDPLIDYPMFVTKSKAELHI